MSENAPEWDGRVRLVDEIDTGALGHHVQAFVARDRILTIALEPSYRPRHPDAIYFRHLDTEHATRTTIERLKRAIAAPRPHRPRRP